MNFSFMSSSISSGLIEAVKMAGKRFVCAVQWHPEYMFKTDADSLKVFSWFVGECLS